MLPRLLGRYVLKCEFILITHISTLAPVVLVSLLRGTWFKCTATNQVEPIEDEIMANQLEVIHIQLCKQYGGGDNVSPDEDDTFPNIERQANEVNEKEMFPNIGAIFSGGNKQQCEFVVFIFVAKKFTCHLIGL